MFKKKAIWIVGSITIFVLLVLAATMYTRTRQLYHLEACRQNMNFVFHALQNYAHDAPEERFPPLSMVPGRLMWATSAMNPEDYPGSAYLISGDHPDTETLFHIAETNPVQAIDDHSYWYLGYTILSEPVLESFIEAYNVAIETGEPVPEIHEMFPEAREVVEERWESHVAEVNEQLQVERARGEASQHKPSYDFPIGNDELNARLILRNGIEQFFIYNVGDRMAAQRKAAEIPILIERPELHGNGGHVLYLDGHVEFIEYPGKFPMTEEYIAGVRELDALGEDD